jgi:hypothetical protein
VGHRVVRLLAAVIVAALLAGGCAGDDSDRAGPTEAGGGSGEVDAAPALAGYETPAVSTGDHGGAPVSDWMSLHADLVQGEVLSPPVASRLFAYAGLALHEGAAAAGAVRSFADELDGLQIPEAGDDLDPVLTANAAVARMSSELLPGAEARRVIASLEEQLLALHGDGLDPATVDASIEAGRSVGDAMAAWAAEDGYAEADRPYERPEGPGLWEPTPLGYARALEPYWGELRSFVATAEECDLPPPVPYSEEPGSDFHDQAQAVVDSTPAPDDPEADIPRFWNDRPGATSTPAGHWVEIAASLIEERELDLATAARTYAALGMTAADSFIANWAVKYRDNVVRPITYIRAHIDPDWRPLMQTPPFPDYPSGHSTLSSAVAIVLTELLGDEPFVDDSRVDVGLAPRRFESFTDAATDAAASRLGGGIHYPMAIEGGIDQGRCVGEAVVERLDLAGT